MIETIVRMARYLLCLLPFILFALLNMKANLERQYRSRQFLMPILTLLHCVVLIVFLNKINTQLAVLINRLPELMNDLALKAGTVLGGVLQPLTGVFSSLSAVLESLLQRINLVYLLLFVSNAVFMLAHVILKRIIISVLNVAFKSGGSTHDFFADAFYEKNEESGQWHVRDHFGQARTFLKTLYIAALVLSAATVLVSCELYRNGLLAVPFYPVFGLMIVGEMYFFLNGLSRREMASLLTGEDEEANSVSNYMLLRKVLAKLFGDKLGADNTTVDNGLARVHTHDELLHELEQDNTAMVEAYGRFMRIRSEQGLKLDHNYLASGLELLRGNSILFNNPFYYDLIPYVSYPMNRTLLRGRKVLIVLGRHDIEGDVETWCRDGLTAVTNVPSLWNIGVLSDAPQELDVGIMTRSSVHDLALHEANDEFFRAVEFVIIVEPSKLVTTAQIGLNSIVRRCRQNNKQLTFCSTDKNCDGLVDALSHILLSSLTEVSATSHHKGTSSYMCWETDDEYLQHRLLPNLSRYLGVGTELSFVALKNQIPQTEWYGGEVFPVVDIHWIASQYYYDLLHYADLPASQEAMDEYFRVSPNLWNAKMKKNQYLTVEDEACNMFEIKRAFSTRATDQGFINIISPEYLLKDYMMDNDSIFTADPKAIPYIVADYAPTTRNVVLRLCLRMSAGQVSEEEIRQELMLIDVDTTDLPTSLWHEICTCCRGVGYTAAEKDGKELLVIDCAQVHAVFTPETLRIKRKFSLESGKMENLYFITDAKFVSLLLDDLQNAGYIAEDEKGDRQYLGTELRGHVFQKYLPGQFFTFGGKYYEMQRVTSGGQVLVRRAADHITGRPAYRQVRNYYLANAVDSPTMGDKMDIAGLQITKQYADIRVETAAYWQMDKYNDFVNGRKISINGVPERVYHGKQVLRIDLPGDGLTDDVCSTITLLFNEVFRTLFAENHAFIAAVTPGEAAVPATYSLSGEGGFDPGRNCIYIIEDSQLDLGLLVAVQRNLNRIFAIICDYLDWHMNAVEKSLNPPREPETPDFTVEPGAEEEKPKTWIGKVFKKIGGFFKKIGHKAGDFFGGLFKRKPKDGEVTGNEDGLIPPDAEDETVVAGGEGAAAPERGETELELAPLTGEKNEEVVEPNSDASQEEPAAEGEEDKTDENDDTMESFTLMSSGAVGITSGLDAPAEGAEEETEHRVEQDELSFEPIGAEAAGKSVILRKPYHERFYLLYGGEEVPAQIDIEGTHSYLEGLGFGRNGLKQARDGMGVADMIEKNFVPDKPGSKYCDFCGAELVGTEYEILSDGRERCMMCSKTAVKTEEEFRDIYKMVVRNMETFFGAKITAPVRVEMVNAKKLHKQLGKSFVPTGSFDGRILGVAIKDKKGYSILVENGAPRMQSTMTIAHELTHIWQYLNWDKKTILRNYGKAQELEVYEGMAKWSEIQYAYLIGESAAAKREEMIARVRQDEYGRGFCKYIAKYPLSTEIKLKGDTPFNDREIPL